MMFSLDTVMGVLGSQAIKHRAKSYVAEDRTSSVEHLRVAVELQNAATQIYATHEDADEEAWQEIYKMYFT